MRGKRSQPSDSSAIPRIIPAHAGQTPLRSCRIRPSMDHPRACGANRSRQLVRLSLDGSSPRMRGKRFGFGPLKVPPRIIPAHAGQTMATRPTRSPSPDHPRACGANDGEWMPSQPLTGSSPRMRGKHTAGRLPSGGHRIIPAHAGQTRTRCRSSCRQSDHPRACGANFAVFFENRLHPGSSPRMRGKLAGVLRVYQCGRIIPAHAGQTTRPTPAMMPSTDHSRTCRTLLW